MSLLFTWYLRQPLTSIQRPATMNWILFKSSITLPRFLMFIKRTQTHTQNNGEPNGINHKWWNFRHQQMRCLGRDISCLCFWRHTILLWTLATESWSPGAGEPSLLHHNAAGSDSRTNRVSNCLWSQSTQPTQKSALGMDTQAPFGQIWQSSVSNHVGILLSH